MLGTLRTFMSDDKAYIQRRDEEACRWVSVVNFSPRMCSWKHKEFCKDIWERLKQPGFGEEAAEARKNALVANPGLLVRQS